MPPVDGGDNAVKDLSSFTVTVPDHLNVYTVTLKRTDVVALENRTIIRSTGDAEVLFWDRLLAIRLNLAVSKPIVTTRPHQRIRH